MKEVLLEKLVNLAEEYDINVSFGVTDITSVVLCRVLPVDGDILANLEGEEIGY